MYFYTVPSLHNKITTCIDGLCRQTSQGTSFATQEYSMNRNLNLALWAAVLVISSLSSAWAQGKSISAKDYVRAADEKRRGNSSESAMSVKIVRPTWSRTFSLKGWTKQGDYMLAVIMSPVKDKGIVFLRRKKEVWNWIPSIERTIKLPPSMMSQSWMGTDFNNDDLVKQFSLVEDYDQTLLGEEAVDGRASVKIQLLPKESAAVVWGKVYLWIDKKDFLILRGEYYDEDGALVTTLIASDVKLLGGRLLPARLEMRPSDKPGNSTVLTYESLAFDQPIGDDFFTPQNMQKLLR